MTIHDIEFTEPEFICQKCGNTKLSYKYVESNNSIQARCSNCLSWYGNIKYEKRSKEEIRQAKIAEWKTQRKQG